LWRGIKEVCSFLKKRTKKLLLVWFTAEGEIVDRYRSVPFPAATEGKRDAKNAKTQSAPRRKKACGAQRAAVGGRVPQASEASTFLLRDLPTFARFASRFSFFSLARSAPVQR
jgi:hypothetical protein